MSYRQISEVTDALAHHPPRRGLAHHPPRRGICSHTSTHNAHHTTPRTPHPSPYRALSSRYPPVLPRKASSALKTLFSHPAPLPYLCHRSRLYRCGVHASIHCVFAACPGPGSYGPWISCVSSIPTSPCGQCRTRRSPAPDPSSCAASYKLLPRPLAVPPSPGGACPSAKI